MSVGMWLSFPGSEELLVNTMAASKAREVQGTKHEHQYSWHPVQAHIRM